MLSESIPCSWPIIRTFPFAMATTLGKNKEGNDVPPCCVRMRRDGEGIFINGDDLFRRRAQHQRLSICHLIDSPGLRNRDPGLDGKIQTGDDVQAR